MIKRLENHISVKIRDREYNIPTDNILYIEASVDYICINTYTKMITIKYSFRNLEKKLNENFIKVHRRFLVNKNKIDFVGVDEIEIGYVNIPIDHTFNLIL